MKKIYSIIQLEHKLSNLFYLELILKINYILNNLIYDELIIENDIFFINLKQNILCL